MDRRFLTCVLGLALGAAHACVAPVDIGTPWASAEDAGPAAGDGGTGPDGGPATPDGGTSDASVPDAGAPDGSVPDASVPVPGARFCVDPHTCALLRSDGGPAPAQGGLCGAVTIGPGCMCTRDAQGRPQPQACGRVCVPDTVPEACFSTNCGDIACLAPAQCLTAGRCE